MDFCPLGPWLTVPEPHEFTLLDNLDLQLRVNGGVRQNDTTANLVFKPWETISELSTFANVAPGDVLLTGTPSGCALRVPPPAVRRLVQLLPERTFWRLFLKSQSRRPEYLRAGDNITATIRSADGRLDFGEQRITVAGRGDLASATHNRTRRHVMKTKTALFCLGPAANGALEVRQVPQRYPAADEVEIAVEAASVNPIDVRRAQGYGARLLSLVGAGKFPLVLGNNFAGTVVTTGKKVAALKPGDRVYGLKRTSAEGTHANRVVVKGRLRPSSHLRPSPSSIGGDSL